LRPTTAGDYANFILACSFTIIGYVRGIVQGDEEDCFVQTSMAVRSVYREVHLMLR